MNKRDKLKLFIEEHKVGLAIMATVAVCGVATAAILRTRGIQWNDFLEANNLTDAFYAE